MHSAAAEGDNPIVNLSGSWYRLIPSRFPTIELYKRIASEENSIVLKKMEMLTNPRVRHKEILTRTTSGLVESSPKLQNWNHAPFAYRNPAGSRYLSGHFGVLEVFDALQTALAVSIRRREAFLSATNHPPINLDMRVLKHAIQGDFMDRTADPIDMPCNQRWKIGPPLLESGAHGIYYRCPELPQGFGLAVFDNEVLGPATQAEHYKFIWDGSGICAIYDYRSDSLGLPIGVDTIFDSSSH